MADYVSGRYRNKMRGHELRKTFGTRAGLQLPIHH
jgi:hypothetical protein